MSHNGTGYYLIVTDSNAKSGDIGSHSEFQSIHQVLNRLKAHEELSTYPESQNMAENVIFASLNDSQES